MLISSLYASIALTYAYVATKHFEHEWAKSQRDWNETACYGAQCFLHMGLAAIHTLHV